MSRKKKSNAGRPSVMTPVVIGKLEYAFSLGCSDREACIFAGINPTSLYDYQKKFPEFTQRKEDLKETQVIKARQAVADALATGDAATARWLLERKRKEEFCTKSIVEPTAPIIRYVTAEDTRAANNHIDSVINPNDGGN